MRPLSSLLQHAESAFLFFLQFSVEDDLVPQMRACATHAFSAVLNKLNPMRRQHCFELFGLDFMVDCNYKVSRQTFGAKNTLFYISAVILHLYSRLSRSMLYT